MTLGKITESVNEIVDIVASADGELVGRTRLQKTAYLLFATGLGAANFRFRYRHYGPFSENLASATDFSKTFGSIKEELQPSSWGGTFSVFRTDNEPEASKDSPRVLLIQLAKKANAIDLELAATSAFLALEGNENPWEETAARKPDKASHIESAKKLYRSLFEIDSPIPLPEIV